MMGTRQGAAAPLLRAWILGAMGVLAALGVGAAGGVVYGIELHRTKAADTLGEVVEHALETRFAILPHWLRGLAARPERLALELSRSDFEKLARSRAEAIERGLLVGGEQDYVPATLWHGDRKLPAKVRLKGDWVDHLTGDKWSFRVRLHEGETLFGMRVFSLQHPRTRNYLYEWLYHRALEREGVLSLRYRFLELTLNGRDLGVYALEEHFEREILSHRERPEGPLLRFDERAHWADLAAHGLKGEVSPTGLQAERASHVDGFRTEEVLADRGSRRRFESAVALLEAFRDGALPASRVFDVEKLARFFAVSDLLGARHGLMWINLRFYADPVSGLLEPVGFDANAGRPLDDGLAGAWRRLEPQADKFKDLVFGDPEVFAAYVRTLERLARPEYVDELLAELADEIDANLAVLYREFPYFHFDPGRLRENQRLMLATLQPVRGLQAWLVGEREDGLELELANPQALPVEVLELGDAEGARRRPAVPLVVRPVPPPSPVERVRVLFPRAAGRGAAPDPERLRLRYRVLGASEVREEPVLPWPRRGDSLPDDPPRRLPNVEAFEFLSVDEPTRTISVRPGRWRVGRDLVLPAGYRIVCHGGAVLDLAESALILSRSPLEFRASEDAPIVVESGDGTGQGLVVLRAGGPSTLEHVVFRGLRSPERDSWRLAAAVTFYESPVEIAHSVFAGTRAEEALRVVGASFRVEETLFRDVEGTALAALFAEGAAARSAFVGVRGDAVDVSASRVELRDLRIRRVADAGVSAGEGSRLALDRVEVSSARVGARSRGSVIEGQGLAITDSGVGVAVERDGPGSGPASIELGRLELQGVGTPYLLERDSRLVVGGHARSPNREAPSHALDG
jgi:hypothetical protein